MWILAALSMTIGNLGALAQRDVKRMLAYSSIAHAGYLLVAFTSFPFDGIAAACFYTATYAAMQVGAFAVITQIAGYDERARTIDDFTGLGQKRPVLAALLSFFLLSLIGIPFTGGFFGKFYVFTAAIHAGHVWLAVIGLLNSGVACFYYLRLLAAVYTRPGAEAARLEPSRGMSVASAVGIALAAIATLVLGILPEGAVRFAEYASHSTLIEQARQECAAHPEGCQIPLQFDVH
jgi:NADH-quinone oxidoreductase subunit N